MAARKQSPAKTPAAKKKPAPKKAAPKKPAAKKAAKAAPKKTAAKKAAPKKPAAKKPAAKQPAKAAPKKKVAAKPPAPRMKPAAAKKPAPPPRQPLAGELGELVAAELVGAVAAEVHVPSDSRGMVTTADGGHIRAPAPPPKAEEPLEGMPNVGDEAPDFTLLGDDDRPVSLAGLRGKKVVLYFYPKDNTPGCTREGQEFSSLLPEFEAENAVVLGVSTDSLESHRKFRHTCDLSVRLLSDPERKAHEAFGTWREKQNYGRTYMGTQRSTFLIDEAGRIEKVWPKVRVEDHALDVLNSLK